MFRTPLILLLAAVATAAPTPRKRIVPNFRDLKVKTRIIEGVAPPRETTWFLKGPRSRVENRIPSMRLLGRGSDPANVPVPMSVGISQCDLRTQYLLRPMWKTYIKQTATDRERPPDEISPLKQLMERNARGPEVTITVDSVDTGERRQMGSYEARRVTTTIVVEPSKRAATKPGSTEIDGWYIDLQGLSCWERDTQELPPQVGRIVMEAVRNNDHVIMKQLGTAQRGFTVEEKSTRKEGGNVIVGKVELLEFSEQPLDPSLFEPPADYTARAPGQSLPSPLFDSDGWVKVSH